MDKNWSDRASLAFSFHMASFSTQNFLLRFRFRPQKTLVPQVTSLFHFVIKLEIQ